MNENEWDSCLLEMSHQGPTRTFILETEVDSASLIVDVEGEATGAEDGFEVLGSNGPHLQCSCQQINRSTFMPHDSFRFHATHGVFDSLANTGDSRHEVFRIICCQTADHNDIEVLAKEVSSATTLLFTLSLRSLASNRACLLETIVLVVQRVHDNNHTEWDVSPFFDAEEAVLVDGLEQDMQTQKVTSMIFGLDVQNGNISRGRKVVENVARHLLEL